MKDTAQSGWQEPLHVQCARDCCSLTGRALYHLRREIQATLKNHNVSMDVPPAWRQTSVMVLYGKGSGWPYWAEIWDHQSTRTKGETGDMAPLMPSVFLETKKEVTQRSCIYHVLDKIQSLVTATLTFTFSITNRLCIRVILRGKNGLKSFTCEPQPPSSDFSFNAESSEADALLPQASKNIKPYLRIVKSLSTQDLILDQMVPHHLL